MKILNIYQKLEFHGWELGFLVGDAFRSLGHTVDDYGIFHDNFVKGKKIKDVGEYDLVFHTETNSGIDYYDVTGCGCPTAIWLIDTHCVGAQKHYIYSQQYNYKFVATKEFVEFFGGQYHNVFWLPNATDPNKCKKMNVTKKYDIGFCGNSVIGRRPKIFNLIKETTENMDMTFKIHHQVRMEQMVEAINSYRVHFNISLGQDINWRVFETVATTTTLLTNVVMYLSDIFIPGKEIITYKSEEELVQKIKFIQNEPEQVVQIGINGYNRFIKDHTVVKRIENVISKIFN